MDVRLIVGSKTDKDNANIFLGVLRDCKVTCQVSYGSCHRHSGGEERKFEKLVYSVEEDIIAMLGGLSLAAPGIIESLLRNAQEFGKMVIGVPTDEHALDAIQALPKGTAILTSGFNSTSVKHSIINAALTVAKLAYMLSKNPDIKEGLLQWYSKAAKENELYENVPLENGLIP